EAGIDAKVLRMQGAKDPDEYIKKYGADKFRELIEASRGKFEFMLDGIRSKYDMSISDSKIKALSEICAYIAGIQSSVERDIYIDKTSREFAVDIKSIKADVDSKRRRIANENSKKRKGELIRITSGLGDRVNPDFAKQPKGARIEEAVLGMLFLHNEYFSHSVDGRPLAADDFVTSLGKRLFEFAHEQIDSGGFNIGMLNESFTQDEVSRVSRMMVERSELSGNDEKSFEIYVRSMREESENAKDGEMSLEDILKKKRGNSN
ncbi:MAG: hypothetical protein J6L96_07285, partial [Clostridia bacterium]|nr:hypothetical protein [Clostridia bacterium]